MRSKARLAGAGAVVLAMAAAAATPSQAATAALKNAEGDDVGEVTLTETPNGVLILADLKGLPEGEHGFHIHETGACAPDFSAAGGHLQGDGSAHGILVEEGPHAGDMPNIHVPASGALTVEVLDPALSIDDGETPLMDDDGAAIVIHAGSDDYRSQPSGDAGARIACGVIEG